MRKGWLEWKKGRSGETQLWQKRTPFRVSIVITMTRVFRTRISVVDIYLVTPGDSEGGLCSDLAGSAVRAAAPSQWIGQVVDPVDWIPASNSEGEEMVGESISEGERVPLRIPFIRTDWKAACRGQH